jgi:hypothetical protein
MTAPHFIFTGTVCGMVAPGAFDNVGYEGRKILCALALAFATLVV